MHATAAVVAEPGPRYPRLRSQAPVVVRPTREGVYLVGGAGGPLGGDGVDLDIEVRAGAELTVRSAAASVALPGAGPSWVRVNARVAPGASLRWVPEPTILAARCRHRVDATVAVGEGARLHWREELILGRHGEAPGSVVSRLQVDYAGRPLLRHELALGPEHPGWDSPAVTAGARAVGSLVLVGPGAGAARVPGGSAAILQLDGPGVQIVAVARDRRALASALGGPPGREP